MLTDTIQTRRGLRPLPPIPVPPGAPTENPNSREVQEPVASWHNRNRDSVLTIASGNTMQTMLPAYSSNLDLTSTAQHTTIARSRELDQVPPSSSVVPNYDPPRYSYILSPSPENQTTPINATLASRDPASDPGGSSAVPQRQQQQRPSFVRHRLYLKKNGAAKPWATLRLTSRAPLPNSKVKTPRFIGGDLVKGALELELDNPMSVQSITINVSSVDNARRTTVRISTRLVLSRSRGS